MRECTHPRININKPRYSWDIKMGCGAETLCIRDIKKRNYFLRDAKMDQETWFLKKTTDKNKSSDFSTSWDADFCSL